MYPIKSIKFRMLSLKVVTFDRHRRIFLMVLTNQCTIFFLFRNHFQIAIVVLSSFLRCSLPADMVNIDLKVRSLKEDFKTQLCQCSPWNSIVKPFPYFSKKINKYLNKKTAV